MPSIEAMLELSLAQVAAGAEMIPLEVAKARFGVPLTAVRVQGVREGGDRG